MTESSSKGLESDTCGSTPHANHDAPPVQEHLDLQDRPPSYRDNANSSRRNCTNEERARSRAQLEVERTDGHPPSRWEPQTRPFSFVPLPRLRRARGVLGAAEES